MYEVVVVRLDRVEDGQRLLTVRRRRHTKPSPLPRFRFCRGGRIIAMVMVILIGRRPCPHHPLRSCCNHSGCAGAGAGGGGGGGEGGGLEQGHEVRVVEVERGQELVAGDLAVVVLV